MRNFDYIKPLGLDTLYSFCSAAEELQTSKPSDSAINARRALDYIVNAVYVLQHVEIPEKASLYQLIDGEHFKSFINDDKTMMAIHYVRKVGNKGAHTADVTSAQSFFALLDLYNVIGAILKKIKIVDDVKPFDRDLIPKKSENLVTNPIVKSDYTKISAIADTNTINIAEPLETVLCDISEDETRKRFIDFMLEEAGWNVLDVKGSIMPLKTCIEIELKGMPNSHEIGYADYVLFGSDGKPLAVIEAKRSSVSPIKGKHQAELYADCLENQYGVRPVIYYSNGVETYIIDGLGYPPRRLYGFHTAKDLELIIQTRRRADIKDLNINNSITDRDYQKRAIKAVCEHFNSKHRKALLVMATGTGKTRVAISLVEVLQRNSWVKNVLFLADRISLVNQSHKNFAKLLPDTTTCVLSDSNGDHDTNARIIFSTYQTMINFIDTEDKPFSVGRFDLIIIDEAHRSIFGKYGAIFNYFDSLLIGLTATPRNQVDKSTYDVFEMENGEPNFAYELEEAVADGYLVNYHGLKRGSQILKEGIKYNNLTDDEKRQLESVWEYEKTKKSLDTADKHRDIESNEIFNYIFNEDTVDNVLQDLMENGIKVQSGERIGKTIIFAYNHRHAELIVKRFNVLYPEYGSEFCVLIDNYVTYSQNLIDKFEIRDGEPQIAVSVDMLDTGIDIPDLLNLVFFKTIKSRIKFMQMIGRGTRLSKDIFGYGKDKQCFKIFDWCRNFEYFDVNTNGNESLQKQSLTERLFCIRADIAFNLQKNEYQQDSYYKELYNNIKQLLYEQISVLSDSHISVRAQWDKVSKFKNTDSWVYISDIDVSELKRFISPLLPKNKLDENAKKFDIIVLMIELSYLDSEIDASNFIRKIKIIAAKLQEKATIPQIQAQMDVINEVLSDVSWYNADIKWLEKVRISLRELIKFIIEDQGRWFIVDIDDTTSDNGEVMGVFTKMSYKQKVIDYIAEHKDLPVINKIYNIQQLTPADFNELERILWEELGTKEDYLKYAPGDTAGTNIAIFLRSLGCFNRREAKERFSKFLEENTQLNANQEDFLDSIINYICANGDIEKETIVNEAPFDQKLNNVFAVYILPLAKYVDEMHNVVMPMTVSAKSIQVN